MASGFNRLAVGLTARGRAEQRWLLRALRQHIAAREAGLPASLRRTRSLRLALGQYLLTRGHDEPVKTVLAPMGALLLYAATFAYIIWKGVHAG